MKGREALSNCMKMFQNEKRFQMKMFFIVLEKCFKMKTVSNENVFIVLEKFSRGKEMEFVKIITTFCILE